MARTPVDREKIALLLEELDPAKIRDVIYDPECFLAMPDTECLLILELVNAVRVTRGMPRIDDLDVVRYREKTMASIQRERADRDR